MSLFSGQKRKKKVVGRWSSEEHSIFVNCLKIHGKDWDKLEEMIPSRSSVQIRSHLQKYFDRIKKEFKTENPMEFIKKDLCDDSLVYKFDRERVNQTLGTHKIQNLKKLPEVKHLSSPKNALQNTQSVPFQSDELANSSKKEEEKSQKKRILKENSKKVPKSSSSSGSNLHQKESSSEYSSVKLFKIEKVARVGTESFSNPDSQKINPNEDEAGRKRIITDFSSSLGVKRGCTLVVLNRGEIILQGNQIETSVPCKVDKLKNTVTAIVPTKKVRIIIEELDPSSLQESSNEKKEPSSKALRRIKVSSTFSKSQSTVKKEEDTLQVDDKTIGFDSSILNVLSKYCICMI
ncbi:unnamed protein product [Moneuplotes crassus]|uniref:Uncharacterized protein n=1 Tax=Euplotes crassus TaxID=5936 RepID=A0AAD1XFX8_EUPCR|nr:unnamed protein product [Moneuplotes crassus]